MEKKIKLFLAKVRQIATKVEERRKFRTREDALEALRKTVNSVIPDLDRRELYMQAVYEELLEREIKRAALHGNDRSRDVLPLAPHLIGKEARLRCFAALRNIRKSQNVGHNLDLFRG